MNVHLLFSMLSDTAAYHATVAERMPVQFWASVNDIFTANAANGNAQDQAQMIADQFKNNRNEMMYDHTPSVSSMDMVLDQKPTSAMRYMFTADTRAMVTMAPRQSFASNATLGMKPVEEYWYEDADEAILEDRTPTNVIMFVPRHLKHKQGA